MSAKEGRKDKKNSPERTGFAKGLKKEWGKISWKNGRNVCREAGIAILLSTVMSVIIAGLDAGILQIMDFAMRF